MQRNGTPQVAAYGFAGRGGTDAELISRRRSASRRRRSRASSPIFGRHVAISSSSAPCIVVHRGVALPLSRIRACSAITLGLSLLLLRRRLNGQSAIFGQGRWPGVAFSHHGSLSLSYKVFRCRDYDRYRRWAGLALDPSGFFCQAWWNRSSPLTGRVPSFRTGGREYEAWEREILPLFRRHVVSVCRGGAGVIAFGVGGRLPLAAQCTVRQSGRSFIFLSWRKSDPQNAGELWMSSPGGTGSVGELVTVPRRRPLRRSGRRVYLPFHCDGRLMRTRHVLFRELALCMRSICVRIPPRSSEASSTDAVSASSRRRGCVSARR